MIDTQEKLDAFVREHRVRILADALEHLNSQPEDQEPDVWGNTWIDHENQVDFNIYQPEDSNVIHIHAYALRHVPEEEPYILQVNTGIGCLVGDVVLPEGE